MPERATQQGRLWHARDDEEEEEGGERFDRVGDDVDLGEGVRHARRLEELVEGAQQRVGRLGVRLGLGGPEAKRGWGRERRGSRHQAAGRL